MTIVNRGVVAAGTASSSSTCTLAVSGTIPRSTPTLARHLVILVQRGGPGAANLSFVTDTAATDPFYGGCYGDGNQYIVDGIGTEHAVFSGGDNLFRVTDVCMGLVLHEMDNSDSITLHFAGAYDYVRAAAVLFEGCLASPHPLTAGRFACNLEADDSGSPVPGNVSWTRAASTPARCNPNQSGESIDPAAWSYGFDLDHLLYVADCLVEAEASWAWDDGTVAAGASWFDQGGALHLSAVLGSKHVAGPVGPFVGNDIAAGGCWNADVSIPNSYFLNVLMGLAAGAGPPACPAPPEPGIEVGCVDVGSAARVSVCFTDPSDGANTCDVFWRITPAVNGNAGFDGTFTDENIDYDQATPPYCVQDPDSGLDHFDLPNGSGPWTVEGYFMGCDGIQGPTVSAELASPCGAGLAITSFNREEGPAGDKVAVVGHGFTGVSAIEFNGVEAESFTEYSDTKAEAIVAAGSSTGKIGLAADLGRTLSVDAYKVTAGFPGPWLTPGMFLSEELVPSGIFADVPAYARLLKANCFGFVMVQDTDANRQLGPGVLKPFRDQGIQALVWFGNGGPPSSNAHVQSIVDFWRPDGIVIDLEGRPEDAIFDPVAWRAAHPGMACGVSWTNPGLPDGNAAAPYVQAAFASLPQGYMNVAPGGLPTPPPDYTPNPNFRPEEMLFEAHNNRHWDYVDINVSIGIYDVPPGWASNYCTGLNICRSVGSTGLSIFLGGQTHPEDLAALKACGALCGTVSPPPPPPPPPPPACTPTFRDLGNAVVVSTQYADWTVYTTGFGSDGAGGGCGPGYISNVVYRNPGGPHNGLTIVDDLGRNPDGSPHGDPVINQPGHGGLGCFGMPFGRKLAGHYPSIQDVFNWTWDLTGRREGQFGVVGVTLVTPPTVVVPPGSACGYVHLVVDVQFGIPQAANPGQYATVRYDYKFKPLEVDVVYTVSFPWSSAPAGDTPYVKEPKFVMQLAPGWQYVDVLDSSFAPITSQPFDAYSIAVPKTKQMRQAGRHYVRFYGPAVKSENVPPLPYFDVGTNAISGSDGLEQMRLDFDSRPRLMDDCRVVRCNTVQTAPCTSIQGCQCVKIDHGTGKACLVPLANCSDDDGGYGAGACLKGPDGQTAGHLTGGWEVWSDGAQLVGVSFNGWEGGNGYTDCLCANRALTTDGTHATYTGNLYYAVGPPPSGGPGT